MGRFYLGSTVITCWPKDAIEFVDSVKTGKAVKLGELLAKEK
jgi:phosphatidylserine decarboxylase